MSKKRRQFVRAFKVEAIRLISRRVDQRPQWLQRVFSFDVRYSVIFSWSRNIYIHTIPYCGKQYSNHLFRPSQVSPLTLPSAGFDSFFDVLDHFLLNTGGTIARISAAMIAPND